MSFNLNETASGKIDGTSVVTDKIANIELKVKDGYTKTVYSEPFETKITEDKHIVSGGTYNSAFTKNEETIKTLVDEVLSDENVIANSISELNAAADTTDNDGKILLRTLKT